MEPLELLNRQRQRPFQPLRLFLNDSRIFDLKYPDLFIVTRSTLVAGIRYRKSLDVGADEFEYLNWSDIQRVEELPLPTAAS